MKGVQLHHAGLKISKLASTYPLEYFLHFFMFPPGLSSQPSTCPEEHFVIFFSKNLTFSNIGRKFFGSDTKTDFYVSIALCRDYFVFQTLTCSLRTDKTRTKRITFYFRIYLLQKENKGIIFLL